ncbi:MAG: hypothetical protein GY715_01090 [Planctomycetes bacterium]|nr:hypothetical protein [Planctomycetota bacterium]
MSQRNTLGRLGALGSTTLGLTVTALVVVTLAACGDQPAGGGKADTGPPTAAAPTGDASAPGTPVPTTDAPASTTPSNASPPTLLGVWVMNRSQGGRIAPGPASFFEIWPNRMRVIDLFNARELIVSYRDIGESKIEITGGLAGVFTEPDGSPGIWGVQHEADGTLTLWQPSRVYGLIRDHVKVREHNKGYAFTEADQKARLAANDRLRAMSVAIFRYGAANEGRLPESLDALVESGLLNGAGDAPLDSPLGRVGDGGGDYWLSPAVKLQGRREPRALLAQVLYPDKEILIYDRTSVLRGKGVHAVFFDGHMELMDDESFARARQHVSHEGVNLQLPKR